MKSIFTLKNKKINTEKLLNYGFIQYKNKYTYKTKIYNNEFELFIEIDSNISQLSTKLKEILTSEEYSLHLVDEAEGEFVGKIREEYGKILKDIKEKCFEAGIFEWDYTYKVIAYCKKKYSDDAEYLWEKFPRNAIIRRKDNKKWYLALLSLNGEKLGKSSDEIIEVIDLRAKSNEIQELLKMENIYPGYHMNKKNWITFILDGSVPIEEIYRRIDISYQLAGKK